MRDGHWQKLRVGFAKSLRMRVLILTLAVFAAIALPAALAFSYLANNTVLKLGTLFAERQILYDRYRGLETLNREVGLAETLARSPAILEWAADETDPAIRERGLRELEHFRLAFRDRSYFFVVHASGHYYFNDATNSYAGNQLRYALAPDNPRDGWYYATIRQGPGCQLNVDHDDNLGVTKVWINCVVVNNARQVLGIIGTGIDLSTFIKQVVNSHQPGVESIFVDRAGSIQASREPDSIDFQSLTKDLEDRKTVYQRADSVGGRAVLSRLLREVGAGTGVVRSAFVDMDGRQMLVGVGFLDKLGWYNVTLMDVDEIVDRRIFLPIAGLLAAIMALAAAMVTWLFKRSVLDRLAVLEGSFLRMERGEFDDLPKDPRDDEIGRLSGALAYMSRTIGDNTKLLEEAVRERTSQLERIASMDPLTGVPNRRGFAARFAAESAKGAGGLLLLDVDRFKSVNDRFGHRTGDEIVVEVSRRIQSALRPGDFCARWGGDEFVLYIHGPADLMELTASRVLGMMRAQPFGSAEGVEVNISCSLGGAIVEAGVTLDAAVQTADIALYEAKGAGRDRAVIHRESPRRMIGG